MIKLYTTGCPKCKVLKKKLDEKGLSYIECTDTDEMVSKGIMSVPVLEVEERLLQFSEAVEWANNQ